jgi:hypothetical protein
MHHFFVGKSLSLIKSITYTLFLCVNYLLFSCALIVYSFIFLHSSVLTLTISTTY